MFATGFILPVALKAFSVYGNGIYPIHSGTVNKRCAASYLSSIWRNCPGNPSAFSKRRIKGLDGRWLDAARNGKSISTSLLFALPSLGDGDKVETLKSSGNTSGYAYRLLQRCSGTRRRTIARFTRQTDTVDTSLKARSWPLQTSSLKVIHLIEGSCGSDRNEAL